MSYHNMRGFRDPNSRGIAERFDAWLGDAVGRDPAGRDRALARWTEAPGARACHPREEHLLPLMVAAGAAGCDLGKVAYRDQVLGVTVSAVHFG
jgi:aromatic ring-opening dioxygenase catalytic subunit (LigB family)